MPSRNDQCHRAASGEAGGSHVRWTIAVWLLVSAYFVAGVFGRSLWKADEPYSFGIVWEMLHGGHWLVPYVAGQPFVEKPPLTYWIAAAFARALSAFRPDESARAGVLAFDALSIGALYAAARILHGEAIDWWRATRPRDEAGTPPSAAVYATLGVLLAAGTVGFAEHVHKLTADVGQLAGAALGLGGLVRIAAAGQDERRGVAAGRGVPGGLLLGTGAGVAFLSKGVLVPALLAVTACVAFTLPAFRTRVARRGCGIAVLVALPWFVVWPLLFHAASPALFDEWLWTNNVGRFTGSSLLGGNHRTIAEKVATIMVFAFPSVPLWIAVARRTLAQGGIRGAWTVRNDAPGHVCVAVFLAATIAVLVVSASMRDVYVLPALPAAVLLGLPALLRAPRRRAGQGRRAVTLVFALAATLATMMWLALLMTGTLVAPQWVEAIIGTALPLAFPLAFDATALAAALVAVGAWIYVVRRDARKSVVVAWSAGFAATWIVGMTLLLPWLDAAQSYRKPFSTLAAGMPSPRRCVVTLNLGESEVSMLEYLAGVEVTRAYLGHSGTGNPALPNPAADRCDWLIALSNLRSGTVKPGHGHWRPVMTVSRLANRSERFTLYRASTTDDVPP